MDRVQVLKQETAALGGDGAEEQPWPEPIQPQEDAMEAAGLYLQDASNRDENVIAYRNGNDMMFKDVYYPSSLSLSDLYRFGENFQYSHTETLIETTSTTFVDFLTLSLSAPRTGMYRINAVAAIENSVNAESVVRLYNKTTAQAVDVELTLSDLQGGVLSTINILHFETLTAEQNTYAIQFRAVNPSRSVSIHVGTIEFWRVG